MNGSVLHVKAKPRSILLDVTDNMPNINAIFDILLPSLDIKLLETKSFTLTFFIFVVLVS